MEHTVKVKKTDRIINPFSWNTIMLREGRWWSVNHYPAGRVVSGEHKPERVEIRYDVRTAKEFAQLEINTEREGISVAK